MQTVKLSSFGFSSYVLQEVIPKAAQIFKNAAKKDVKLVVDSENFLSPDV